MDITITLAATAIFVATMLMMEQGLESTPEEYAEKLSRMVRVPKQYWVYITVAPDRLLNAEVWQVNGRNTNTRPVCTLTYPLPARLSNISARRIAKGITSDFKDHLCGK